MTLISPHWSTGFPSPMSSKRVNKVLRPSSLQHLPSLSQTSPWSISPAPLRILHPSTSSIGAITQLGRILRRAVLPYGLWAHISTHHPDSPEGRLSPFVGLRSEECWGPDIHRTPDGQGCLGDQALGMCSGPLLSSAG